MAKHPRTSNRNTAHDDADIRDAVRRVTIDKLLREFGHHGLDIATNRLADRVIDGETSHREQYGQPLPRI